MYGRKVGSSMKDNLEGLTLSDVQYFAGRMSGKFKTVKFDDVKYVGYANERLILRVCYTIGKEYIEEEMFIHEGKLWFLDEGSKLKRFYGNEEIDKKSYNQTMDNIKKEANRWCRNLGLQEVPVET